MTERIIYNRDPVKPRNRESSKRKILAVPAYLALILGSSYLVAEAIENTPPRLSFERTTREQEDAALLLRTVASNQKVHGAVAIGAKEGDKVIPVNLRNKPRIPADYEDFTAGEVVNRLKQGTVVSEAIVVLGNNPQFPQDSKQKVPYLAFKDPNNSRRVVFAYSGLFEVKELENAPKFNLSSGASK